MTLIERLLELSRLWCEAHGRSLSRLATIVANDGKVLSRLEDGRTCTVAMVERFLNFFRDPASWPEGAIPADVAARLDELAQIATASGEGKGADDLITDGNTPDGIVPSSDNGAEIIGTEAESHRPFATSSPTCSATIAPSPQQQASPASSVGEAA
jgi:hypothetical protein